jgi:hypothetical protein
MRLKLKIWWNRLLLQWRYRRYLSTRNAYKCGDTLFFASRPDMDQVWRQLITHRKYVIDLMKMTEKDLDETQNSEEDKGSKGRNTGGEAPLG